MAAASSTSAILLRETRWKSSIRIHTTRGQSASKIAGWRSSGHSDRSASSEPPPLSGSASWTRMIGLPWDRAARTSRRQFCAEGAAGEGEGSRPHSGYMNEHLALEVASREEDEDHLRAADVALQSADVIEIIHL